MAGERRTQSMVLLAGGIAPAAAGLRPHVGLGWPKGDPGSWKAKEKSVSRRMWRFGDAARTCRLEVAELVSDEFWVGWACSTSGQYRAGSVAVVTLWYGVERGKMDLCLRRQHDRRPMRCARAS
ncbi:hypothetical protein BD310DRAFT_316606 [Dichomitus squalens]|uniref:Uncharacterized protein n=1 Tax=Dichomitus squalens TaxID=114155 RepID=A0A4Q9PES4_9APHY|nr:hypothetical protein BD310DRAFT_316606 [Dichomitus squalens]